MLAAQLSHLQEQIPTSLLRLAQDHVSRAVKMFAGMAGSRLHAPQGQASLDRPVGHWTTWPAVLGAQWGSLVTRWQLAQHTSVLHPAKARLAQLLHTLCRGTESCNEASWLQLVA
jgi:hypothetical protein